LTGSVDGAAAEDHRPEGPRPGGETFALVGESRCGKSITGYAMLGIVKATAGQVELLGTDLTRRDRAALRDAQRDMQIISFSSLDPKMTVGESVGEPLIARGVLHGAALARRRGAGAGRPAAAARWALSARVLRRPAPAHRDRARALRTLSSVFRARRSPAEFLSSRGSFWACSYATSERWCGASGGVGGA
jgi:ABC-type glutathione transport system ATPase component